MCCDVLNCMVLSIFLHFSLFGGFAVIFQLFPRLTYIMNKLYQGCHFPDNMKFPDFSRPRLSSTVSSRPFRGSGGMLPQKSFKIRMFNLAENEFQATKLPDFSLTFGILWQIP